MPLQGGCLFDILAQGWMRIQGGCLLEHGCLFEKLHYVYLLVYNRLPSSIFKQFSDSFPIPI